MSGSEDNGGGLTLGERIRKIEDGVDTVLSKVTDLDSRDRADLLRHQQAERRLTALEDHPPLEQRVSALESWQTWAQRLVLGLVMTALVVGVLVTR